MDTTQTIAKSMPYAEKSYTSRSDRLRSQSFREDVFRPKVDIEVFDFSEKVAPILSAKDFPKAKPFNASSITDYSSSLSLGSFASTSESQASSDGCPSSDSSEVSEWIELSDANYQEIKIDLSFFNICFAENNVEEILKDQKLFWILFCKLHQNVKSSSFGVCKFATEEIDGYISLKGLHLQIDLLTKQIEQLRQIFLRNWATKSSFMIVAIEFDNEIYIREQSDILITLHHNIIVYERISPPLYYEHTKPTIRNICSFLKMKSSMRLITQKFYPRLYSREACFDAMVAFDISFN